ncbi:MAG: HU family DNA-binding protein [Syntrophobacteraceae bacterium]
MTKGDIIEELARLGGINLREAERAVNAAFDSMSKALAKGSRIEIRGVGSFQVKEYDQCAGHNPKTGAPIIVAAKRLPLFRPAKELKERVGRKCEEVVQTPARKA